MNLLKKHFDTALESPDGIKKLRELILTLAMQGKLVKQDPNDQPASELLKEIQVEKERMIKEGKIKKQKELPPIKPDEIPYEVPKGWAWVTIGNIATIERGGSPRPINLFLTEDLNGYNWIKIGDTDKGGKYITSTKERIIPEGLTKTRKVYPGDFLLTNSMSFGRPYITKIEGCIHDGWLRIAPPNSVDKDYLYNLLSSGYVLNVFSKAASGAVVQNLNSDKVRELKIPLPPLAEQKRIVTKIDELMALCDKLEAQRNARNEKQLAVHTASINRLLTASGKADFDSAWKFITRQFDPLYSVKENVTELKKAILTLAMQGKLVKQDPKDQPASELLKEIQSDKVKLIKEGKIKRQKELPPIRPDEVPYELPKGWEWTRLGEISFYNGRSNAKAQDIDNNTWVLDLEDIEKDTSRIIYRAKYSERQSKSNKSFFQKGDVLYGKLRPYLNKVVIADNDGVCTTEIVPIIPSPALVPEFLLWLLKRPMFISHVNDLSYGVKMPRLGTESAINSIHPLPPLAEQKRIVSKIDELMVLCDKLGNQIDQATAKQTSLFDAVLAQVH